MLLVYNLIAIVIKVKHCYFMRFTGVTNRLLGIQNFLCFLYSISNLRLLFQHDTLGEGPKILSHMILK